MNRMTLLLNLCFIVLAFGCRSDREDPLSEAQPTPEVAPTPTDRIEIPPTVRSNLGITFARVEVRNVARTIRVPGSFELSPEARREYRTMASGRVELHVGQFAEVQPGQVLYSLDSPDWRELQNRLNEIELSLEQSRAGANAMEPLLTARQKHQAELERAIEVWTQRVDQLEASRDTGVVSDEDFARARGTLAAARADLAEVLEKEAELRLRKAQIEAELNAHRERFELMLANAGSLLSLPTAKLLETSPESPEHHPRWREIRRIEVRAEVAGVIEVVNVTNGAWVDQSSLVLTTVQPDRLRFRAMGLQADLPRLANGAEASIAPPRTPGLDTGDSVAAELRFGLDAHPENRTITLIAQPAKLRSWMRPGVSAFLEVVVESSGGKALAIPRSSIVKDGITHVYFRRDPGNPNQAIRIEADMGVDDGRWVVIHSGLTRNDEVVLNGAYELKLATAQSGTSQKGGHFHADGSYHGEH